MSEKEAEIVAEETQRTGGSPAAVKSEGAGRSEEEARRLVFPAGVPKYMHLAEVLREAIASDNVGPDGIMIADDRLMRRFGVSRSTVRQAVDMLVREGLVIREPGRGTFVRAKPKAKVSTEFLIEAVGWSFEAIVENRYVRDVVVGIEEACEEAGAQFRLYPVREESLLANGLIEELRDPERRAGLLLLWPYPIEEVKQLVRWRIPVVSANMNYTRQGAGSVVTNSEEPEALVALIGKLAEKGHRRIGFLVSEELSLSKKYGQVGGYEMAVVKHELEEDGRLLQIVEEDADNVAEMLMALLSLDEPPTAVLAGNEPILEGLIDAAETEGVRVPKDLSLGGFTTVDFDEFYSGMRLDQREMGRMAAEMLLGMLEKPGSVGGRKVLEVKYHKGKSFGRPAGRK